MGCFGEMGCVCGGMHSVSWVSVDWNWGCWLWVGVHEMTKLIFTLSAVEFCHWSYLGVCLCISTVTQQCRGELHLQHSQLTSRSFHISYLCVHKPSTWNVENENT